VRLFDFFNLLCILQPRQLIFLLGENTNGENGKGVER